MYVNLIPFFFTLYGWYRPILKGGIIICALRSYDINHAFEMVHLCKSLIDDQVVIGFDICGDEGRKKKLYFFGFNYSWYKLRPFL